MIHPINHVRALSPEERYLSAEAAIPVPRTRPYGWRCPGCGVLFNESAGYAAHLMPSRECARAATATIIVCGQEVIDHTVWVESKELGGGKTGRQRTIYGISPNGVQIILKRCKDMNESKRIVKEARCQQPAS